MIRPLGSYGVRAADHHEAVWYHGATRELFAASKSALDATVEPDSQFLGPKEPGVARAPAGAR